MKRICMRREPKLLTDENNRFINLVSAEKSFKNEFHKQNIEVIFLEI